MELKLVKYRGTENDYVYFWTELQNDIDVHVSPMFSSTEDAFRWIDEVKTEVKIICDRMKETK